MKKLTKLLLLIAVLWFGASYAQDTPRQSADYSAFSGFTLASPDVRNPQVVDNLEALCRVWGYVKYHHPIFVNSTVNVDYELFNLLPKVAHADKASRNKVLYEWVKGLGEYTTNQSKYDEESAGVQHWSTVDLGWTADTARLGTDLSALLQGLRYAERGENRYAQAMRMDPNAEWSPMIFGNEDFYQAVTRYDCGYQLLTLFRLWNLIEYYGPNKLLTDKPWDEVLTEYIPRMAEAKDLDYYFAVMELNRELCDGHVAFPYEFLFGTRTVPTWVEMLDGDRLVVTNPGKTEGLQRGDEIVRIDGRPTAARINEIRRYVSVSNEAGLRQSATYYSLASPKEEYMLAFLRNGTLDSMLVKTVPGNEFNIYEVLAANEPYRSIDDQVGYIDARVLTEEMFGDAMEAFRDTKAIIVDLRGYPACDVSMLVGEYFTEKPVRFAKWSTPFPGLPGEFRFEPDEDLLYKGMAEEAAPKDNPDAYKGRVIVLVNEMTQSAGESAVMCFQALPNTTVVGSQTAGANGTGVMIPLPKGFYTRYSSIGCYYPDGREVQRKGVKIDIEVLPTIDGIRAGRDQELEKALDNVKR